MVRIVCFLFLKFVFLCAKICDSVRTTSLLTAMSVLFAFSQIPSDWPSKARL